MRTTVGPLPSAVYWRRRAVVLGAVLLGIIVLFVSCTGDDDGDKGQGSSSSQYPTPAPGSTDSSSSPDTEPSFLDGAPGSGPKLPAPGQIQSQSPGTNGAATAPTLPTTTTAAGTGQNNNVTVPADGSCADTEIALTPVPSVTSVKRGSPVEIQLKIKNNSTRTCSRDVGPDPQELYLDQGARKYWSSDMCSTAKGSDVRQLRPGEELVYKVTWNGRQSNSCTSGSASGPNPPPGQFELRGRLGSLYSNPVAITISA